MKDSQNSYSTISALNIDDYQHFSNKITNIQKTNLLQTQPIAKIQKICRNYVFYSQIRIHPHIPLGPEMGIHTLTKTEHNGCFTSEWAEDKSMHSSQTWTNPNRTNCLLQNHGPNKGTCNITISIWVQSRVKAMLGVCCWGGPGSAVSPCSHQEQKAIHAAFTWKAKSNHWNCFLKQQTSGKQKNPLAFIAMSCPGAVHYEYRMLQMRAASPRPTSSVTAKLK